MTQKIWKDFLESAKRLDGTIFLITSPRFYCRPICKNAFLPAVRLTFSSAAAAELAGYFPCDECHPESAPPLVPLHPEDAIARAVLCRLQDGILTYKSIDAVANGFGLTSRHMRRIIQKNCGASPIQVAQTYRLHLAKRLLQETELSIAEVALASGFTSVRRLNSLFSKRYQRTPSKLRSTTRSRRTSAQEISFELSYRAPYDYQSVLSHLRQRAFTNIEEVTAHSYSRSVAIGDSRGWLTVELGQNSDALRLTVSRGLVSVLAQIVNRVKRLFDLAADTGPIADRLGSLAFEMPGVRMPGAFEPTEAAVRILISYAYNEDDARTLLKRFTTTYAENLMTPFTSVSRVFSPERLLHAISQSDLTVVGLSRAVANQLNALGKLIHQGTLSLHPTPYVVRTIERLVDHVGVEPCLANYIALRCLGWTDAFPHENAHIAKKIAALYNDAQIGITETWKPWRSYASVQLFQLLSSDSSGSQGLRTQPVPSISESRRWL